VKKNNTGVEMYNHHASEMDCHRRQALGPYPRLTIAVLADLDLSDSEIGRYFGIPSRQVAWLRPCNLADELSSFSAVQKGS
jgi:hypothetical protein